MGWLLLTLSPVGGLIVVGVMLAVWNDH